MTLLHKSVGVIKFLIAKTCYGPNHVTELIMYPKFWLSVYRLIDGIFSQFYESVKWKGELVVHILIG